VPGETEAARPAPAGDALLAKVVRTFSDEHTNGTTLRRLTRNVDVVSVPRRSDRVRLPDVEDELVVEKMVILGTYPDRNPGPTGTPRLIVYTNPEGADGYSGAVALGWRPA
jgi:hypothetical protein